MSADTKEQIVVYNRIDLDSIITNTYNEEDIRVKAIKALKAYGDPDSPLYEFNSVQDAIRVMNPTYKLTYDPTETAKYENEELECYIKHVVVRDSHGIGKHVKVFTEDGFYDYLFKARNEFAKRFRKFVRVVLQKLRKKGSVTIQEAVDDYKNYMKELEKKNEQINIKLLSSENKIARQELVVREYQERIKNLDSDLNSELMANRLKCIMEDEEIKFQKLFIYAGNFEYYPAKVADIETQSINFSIEGETAEEIRESLQPYAFYIKPMETKEKASAVDKKSVKDQYDNDVILTDEKNEILVSYVKVRVCDDDSKEKKDTKTSTIKKLLDFIDKEFKLKLAVKSRKTYIFCDYNLLKTCIDTYNFKEIDEKFLKERE
jgi:prophage antirepressor-like protein